MSATQEKINMNQDIAKAGPKPHSVARFSEEQIAESQLHNATDLPALGEAAVAPVPLSVSYWQPEIGDSVRGYILGISNMEMPDFESGEIKQLESVLFVSQTADGQINRHFNASKILVANCKDAIQRGEIIPATRLTPVQITYLGEKKNTRNAFKSRQWSILPLIVSVQ